MDIKILIGAVKEKLGPKRKMSETEADAENMKRGMTAASDYIKNKKSGSMGPIEFAEPGKTDAKPEYITDKAMRNVGAKNLAEKMKDKELNK